MRKDSKNFGGGNYLHWHDGTSCVGHPNLQACLNEAIYNKWIGKVLRKDDKYENGEQVSCYSMIVGQFDHWAKHGTYVAVTEVTSRLLAPEINPGQPCEIGFDNTGVGGWCVTHKTWRCQYSQKKET